MLRSIIETERDIEAGVAALAKVCPDIARAVEVAGLPPLRRWSAGFEGLARIVTGQQLSVASANAILARLRAAVDPLDADGIHGATDAILKAAGLSAGKIATLRSLSAAVRDKRVDFAALATAPPEAVHDVLTAIHGIGPWTADIWLVLCRGDADAFASGDLALAEAVRDLLTLDARPRPAELSAVAERWRPWRGVAARVLWAYYAARKAERRHAGGDRP